MDARSIIASLLSCGSLDAGFLIHIFDTYSISLPEILDEIEMAYWEKHPSFNQIITVALERVASEFLENVVKHRKYRFHTTNYTTFSNYLDSHVWFDDENLNRWFESWRKH